MEDDASGALAHRRMVQTRARVLQESGAAEEAPTFNPFVHHAAGPSPRAPTRGSVTGTTPPQVSQPAPQAQTAPDVGSRDHTAYV